VAGDTDQADRAGIVEVSLIGAGQRMAGSGGEQPQVVHSLQPGRLGRQLGVLPRPGIGRRDLFQSELQQIGLAGAFLSVVHQVVALGTQLVATAVGPSVVVEQRRQLGTTGMVENLALPIRVAQPDLLGLTMNGREFSGHFGQLRYRGLDTPDEDP